MNRLARRYFCLASKDWNVGDFYEITKYLTQSDLDKFSELSGDFNPIHTALDNRKPIVHGAFLNSIMSGIIGTKIPGPGTIVVQQNLSFPNKCHLEDPITFRVELTDVRKIIKVKYECTQNGVAVFQGDAKLVIGSLCKKPKT